MGNLKKTMTDEQDIYFEISNNGNLIRLEPIESVKYDSELDWDKNWIKTKVIVKGGNFAGQYFGDFLTIDLENFKLDLHRLYDNLNSTVRFCDLEGYLDIRIIGDGIGHFVVKVRACDVPGIYGSELSFEMTFDQTEIKGLERQLYEITKRYPMIGEFRTRNQ
jgi:hypothetical protein